MNDEQLEDFRTDVEHIATYLLDTVQAFTLFAECLEEGYHSGNFDNLFAITFVRRLPMLYSTYNIITEYLTQHVKELDTVVRNSYHAGRVSV